MAAFYALGRRASAVMMGSWAYAAYANWFGSLVGALTAASRLTPIAGAGTTGDALSEAIVSFLLQSLAVAALVGTSLAVWDLRKVRTAEAGAPLVATAEAPPA